ncbi:hypothetical protein [Siphonobacter sp. SORGH_AS_1065]|uniref:hypothetical protein n=1 Tax=Siphonobacter sp. SORGH_AS_1065 TaxID=3041795 RepID=UPI002780A45D|nr:hypothetical protein [Siphonobacter sp. SORGH_AS_1065]MDQ1087023.1 hypothetical protein [Siphonobacter sp. SORGH_AS_1065]
MNRNILGIAFWVVLYLLLQVFFFRSMILFDHAFCFIYIASVLSLPFDTPRTWVLLLAFVSGFFVDFYYNTLGLHAACTVFLAFARPGILRLLTPARGYEERNEPTLEVMNLWWVIRYTFIAALLHHALLFSLESLSLALIAPTLIKIIASTFYSTLVIVILQFFRGN